MTGIAQDPREAPETPDPAPEAAPLALADPACPAGNTRSVSMDAAEYDDYQAFLRHRRRQRNRPARENREYAAFASRSIRGLRKRGAGDLDALTLLNELSVEIEDEMSAYVAELVGGQWHYSWAQIAKALGMTRSGAWKRFPKARGVRMAGGQPGSWR